MNRSNCLPHGELPETRLRLFGGPVQANAATAVPFWLINGYPATIIIWTQEQWADLADRPSDAQYHPNGVWCALRMQ